MSGRYAVYFVPDRNTYLYQLGSCFLGRSVFKDDHLPEELIFQWPSEAPRHLTSVPKFYGFHATIKAPFELDGSPEKLKEALAGLAAQTAPFQLPPLAVSFVDDFFLALTLTRSSKPLAELEKNCLTALAPFTRPLSQEDRDRRGALTPRQAKNLREWGYHRVLEDFQFHLTLTGPIQDRSTVKKLTTLAEEYFAKVLGRENKFDCLTLLYQEDRQTPFEVLEVFPLTGV